MVTLLLSPHHKLPLRKLRAAGGQKITYNHTTCVKQAIASLTATPQTTTPSKPPHYWTFHYSTGRYTKDHTTIRLPHHMPPFTLAQWAKSTKNPDVSTGPLARPFARSLTALTHLLASHYLLFTTRFSLLASHYSPHLQTSLRSLARSLVGQ